MFDRKSDYALNRKEPDATVRNTISKKYRIIYPFAETSLLLPQPGNGISPTCSKDRKAGWQPYIIRGC